ncbi:MAG: arylsulfatase [Planctomycetota bacterium]|nr:MAG: arylsulfatase [Planctomycetota bacterium]
MRRPPNVVLVITDDQGYGDLGCHGNTVIKTPNLDKLYLQSVRLTNFHVCPTCAPTRASLMTGRYCNRTGVWHTVMGRSLLRSDEVTMADLFAANGYRTGIFGKWHLGDNYPFRPQDRGFQEVLVHGGGGVGQTPDYWGNDYFDDTYWHNGKPKKFAGYCTDVWFNEALKFIEESADRPFFCYLSTNAPHWPYNVADKYVKLYKGKDRVPNGKFYGMITNIDDNVGQLLKKLKDLRLEWQTVLIFMTDNGTAEGWRDEKGYNAGMRGIKGSEYDGGHRVPCFIRWLGGGLGRGKDVVTITAHIDLLPTLIELCRLQGPEGVKFDGKSLMGVLFGRDADWPERIVITDSQRVDHPEKWRKSAVMTDRWRLINGKRLYDMKANPGQKKNLGDEHPKVVEKLRKAYEQWWTDISKRFDEYCEIVIGSDKENASRLTCHDWHSPNIPWNQDTIRSAVRANGSWAVEVARDGTYEFVLRRWPEELDLPITKTICGGKAISAVKARLKIADVDLRKPVQRDATGAAFRVNLKAGKTRLQTWFTDDKGNSRGAYYVYVKRFTQS